MAPTPATGFSFGSPAPAPAASGFSFGSSAPAPGTSAGLFGSTSSPAPAAPGLFGSVPAPAPAFGTAPAVVGTGMSGFGGGGFGFSSAQAPAASTAPMAAAAPVPAASFTPADQAALYAHQQQTHQRQEAERLGKALTSLHSAYNAVPGNAECRFQHIFYDSADANTVHQHRAWGTGRPAHVDANTWARAEAHNPDPEKLVPVSVTGVEQLQSRISNQQAQSHKLRSTLTQLRTAADDVKQSVAKNDARAQNFKNEQFALVNKVLRAMRKVEVLRCMNIPTQPAEIEYRERLDNVIRGLADLQRGLVNAVDSAEQCKAHRVLQEGVVDLSRDDQTLLHRAFQDQKMALEKLTKISKTDQRDLDIIKKGLQKRMA